MAFVVQGNAVPTLRSPQRAGTMAASKVWKFNINIDLGKAKQLTLGGVLGGVVMAILAEGAATVTHLVIDHRWRSVAASGEQAATAAKQAQSEPSISIPSMPFHDRWSALLDPHAAPASFVSWWHFYEEFSSSRPIDAPYHNSRVRDHKVSVVSSAGK